MSQQFASEQKTNRTSVAAMVACFVLPPLGILLGHIALHRISKHAQRGRSLALAATILSYVFLATAVLLAATVAILVSTGALHFSGVTFCSGSCGGSHIFNHTHTRHI